METLQNYNPVHATSQEEADAWAAIHPEVPVKVVARPLVNVNVERIAETSQPYEQTEKHYPTFDEK